MFTTIANLYRHLSRRPRWFGLALLCCFILHPSALILSQTSPFLRIETGMHTAAIKRIATDAQGRWLVTASEDKTARVWDLATGTLLRTLRPPIGDGGEGKLYAAALSPDGNTIAVGGFTSPDGLNTNIYLFDRASGRLTQRLAGLPNVVLHLAFAPDGRWLAATLGDEGVRVYDAAQGYRLAFSDTAYGSDSYGADFTPDSSGLATSCWDGQLRRYTLTPGNQWQLTATQPAPGGKQPYAMKFAPDGTRLAVGYEDTTRVSVVNGLSLQPRYEPDTTGVDNGELCKVAWSRDGGRLYAGGRYSDKNNYKFLRVWAEGGRGAARDVVTGARATILDLAAAGGGMAYGAAEPSWALMEGTGREVRRVTSALADYRDDGTSFRLSENGLQVQFEYEQNGQALAHFAVVQREVQLGKMANGNSPRTTAEGLQITDWFNSYTPKLNGAALALEQYERSRRLALARDGSALLLGTEWHLRCFDRAGRERWQVAAPDVAWAVNVSEDGRLAVAAYGDGTIRWYRMTDGAELLAFFPHADRKQWVLWTPQGYYDASPGAEDLIGWHVNNGPDAAADFYPLALFFEQYYQPDIVSEVLRTASTVPEILKRRGEKEHAQAAIAIKRPPRVAFLAQTGALATDDEQFELCLAAEDLGGGVDEVRLYQNGKLVPENGSQVPRGSRLSPPVSMGCNSDPRHSGLGAGPQTQRRFSVTLTEGVNQFKAIALSTDRVESKPAETAVTLNGGGQTADLHLLTVGLNRYENSALNLNFAEPDANAIRDFFTSAAPKRLFRNVVTHHLLNDKATLAGLRQAFAEVKAQAKEQDVVVVYLAGHGLMLDKIWYFLPHDLTTPEDGAALKQGGFSTLELGQELRAIKAQKIFVMIDACNAGGASLALRGVEDRKALVQLARSVGAYLLAAGTDTQLAAEVKTLGHGVFTHVLLEGLRGKAGTGKVTVEGVMLYVKNALPEVSEKYRSYTQYPISQGYGTDFPLAVSDSFTAAASGPIKPQAAKPAVLKPQLLNAANFADTTLAQLLEQALDTAGHDSSAPFVFVKTGEPPPEAVELRGIYTVSGDTLKLTLSFIRNGATLGPQLTLTGSVRNPDPLVKQILAALVDSLKTHGK